MKLNPTKCAFRVFAGNFLGFIVNNREIEANLDKIRVVLDMQPPLNTKEVQCLTRRIVALSRFMSRSNDKCYPFFQILKKAFQWDVHCEEAFTALKTYLSSPPILVSPSDGELLTLYLAVSDFSTSAALVKERDRMQQSVYYCSRAMRGPEKRYPKVEKLVLALVTTARRLRPYFQAQTIKIPTKHPMKQILHKPKTSGRLVKWAIEWSEFDIRYKPRIVIKGQILVNFIMKFTSAEPTETAQLASDLPIWRLSIDGVTNAHGSGAGLILTSPDGINMEYALKFRFQASKNKAKYEAVIAGLNLAHSMEADQLEVCSDSHLVVKQIEGDYKAKGEKMIHYLKKVRELLRKIVRVQVRHIPRTENSWAEALAKLATTSQEDLERRVPVEHLMEPSVDVNSDEVLPVMTASSWMDPIWDYLLNGILPSDLKEASKLRARSARFALLRGTLYKRGFSTPLLKCIGKEDANYVLREVHEGICGNHIEARALVGKTLRQGNYWSTMLKDATELVKKCGICQEQAKISHLPAEPLTSIINPWPFQQ